MNGRPLFDKPVLSLPKGSPRTASGAACIISCVPNRR